MANVTADDAFTQLLHQAALSHQKDKEFSEDTYRAFRSGADWAKGLCFQVMVQVMTRLAGEADSLTTEAGDERVTEAFYSELEKIKNGNI